MSKKLKFLIFPLCLTLFYFSSANAAIQFPEFGTSSFDEANPALVAAERGQQYVQNEMMLAQELRAKQLENQIMEQQLAQSRQEQENVGNSNKKNKIMIFSQNKYPVYLGCLSCPMYVEDSIHNDGNSYGSNNGKKSIYNAHNVYGSSNSDLSACNRKALHPPIVVNNRGVLYGLLTLNTKLHGAIKEPLVLKWLQTRVCRK